MDLRKVKKLIELVEESGINELEIKEGEDGVRIVRQSAVTAPVASTPPQPAVVIPSSENIANDVAANATDEPEQSQGHVLRSPMVGTFYSAPSPGAPAFVEPGQAVKKGQTVCIVEAMKMLNQIEADRSGIVREVIAQNEQPVEFDQPLMVIE